MIKELMYDPIFLAGKSELATKEDLLVVQDLLDTLLAHKDGFLCLVVLANANAIMLSKCNGKLPNSKSASKPSPAGQRRSSIMK